MTDGRRITTYTLALIAAGLAWSLIGGCGIRTVDVDTLPDELREPYALFETRCSKCHTIARPLNAPVRDATHWELYIARMRRVPGSGINHEDARQILRFLIYYTDVIRGGGGGGTSGGAARVESSDSPPAAGAATEDANRGDGDEPGVLFEDEEADDATGE